MNKTLYRARIDYTMYEDDYNEGEGELISTWDTEIIRDTPEMLKMQVIESTHQKDFSTIDDEQHNEYDWCTEYSTSYLADQHGLSATESEIERWKKGEIKLFAVHCHILVTKVVEEKASL